jgi:hypothetical protein
MAPSSSVPSAWDDDFDNTTTTNHKITSSSTSSKPTLLSRHDRRAAHLATNASLWSTAESSHPTPTDFLALQTASTSRVAAPPPSVTAFKPALKVLSRKPTTGNKVQAQQDEEDSEDEARRLADLSLSERKQKAATEREDKERRYREVRARLFGEAEVTTDALKTSSINGRRGGARGGRLGRGGNSTATSSADQSPARGEVRQPAQKVLYDPSYTPKPVIPAEYTITRRSSPKPAIQPVRQPRGPDASGRGGFGFAGRSGADQT